MSRKKMLHRTSSGPLTERELDERLDMLRDAKTRFEKKMRHLYRLGADDQDRTNVEDADDAGDVFENLAR